MEYNVAMILSQIKKSDFSQFRKFEEYKYKDITIFISYDRYNSKYVYWSNDVELSGFAYNIADLKNNIKFEYKKIHS